MKDYRTRSAVALSDLEIMTRAKDLNQMKFRRLALSSKFNLILQRVLHFLCDLDTIEDFSSTYSHQIQVCTLKRTELSESGLHFTVGVRIGVTIAQSVLPIQFKQHLL